MAESLTPPQPKGPYATTRRVGDVLYLAGQGAIDPTTGSEIWRYTLTDGAPTRRGSATPRFGPPLSKPGNSHREYRSSPAANPSAAA